MLTYLELDIQEEQQDFKMARKEKEKTQFLINADRGRNKSNLLSSDFTPL